MNGLKKLSLIGLIFFPLSIMAQSYYKFKPNTLLRVNIAAKNITRVSFNRNIIQEVVGDQSAYQLISDLNSSNIFVIPKVPSGSKFTISLINNRGQAQDIEFAVKDIAPSPIIISSKKPLNEECSINDEAIHMLKAMKAGIKSKYYVLTSNRHINKNSDLRIIQKKTYRFKNLIGSILSVKNISKQEIEVSEIFFANLFINTILTSCDHSKQLLKPHHETKIFVISQDKSGVYK